MPDSDLQKIFDRLHNDLSRDTLIQTTTDKLRITLAVDRVVLYYFYYKWSGKVTFESLSDKKFSILGYTGPDECFNGEYAALYEAGRVQFESGVTPCKNARPKPPKNALPSVKATL